jgi:hypothetical protein
MSASGQWQLPDTPVELWDGNAEFDPSLWRITPRWTDEPYKRPALEPCSQLPTGGLEQ